MTVKCVVEIPKGSRNKYEYDADAGGITLDRFLSSSVVYPTDYGFVPQTLALDGDTLDALICVSEPTFPGCIVMSKPIGLFEMEDEKGTSNPVRRRPSRAGATGARRWRRSPRRASASRRTGRASRGETAASPELGWR